MFVEHKEEGESVPVVNPLAFPRLSALIRVGSMNTAQCKSGHYVEGDSACAVGAAMLAAGMTKREAIRYGLKGFNSLSERFPHILKGLDAFSEAHGFPVIHANDIHGWSREAIADWLESKGY